MKSFIWILGVLVIISFAVGCNNDKKVSVTERVDYYLDNVILCIQDKNNDDLQKLFCNEAIQNRNLYEEIETLFEFIDGDIISCEDKHGSPSSKTTKADKGIVQETIRATVTVNTSTGKKYEILCFADIVNDEDKNKIGLAQINVFDLEFYNSECGYPDTSYIFVGADKIRN